MIVVVACLSCESFFWCIGSSMYLRIAVALTYVLLLRLVRCPVPWKANCSVLLAQLWALPVVWLDDHQLFFCRFREPDVAFALRIVVADKKFIDWLRVGDLLEFLGSLWKVHFTSFWRREPVLSSLLLLSRRLLQICPEISAESVDSFLEQVAMSQPRYSDIIPSPPSQHHPKNVNEDHAA